LIRNEISMPGATLQDILSMSLASAMVRPADFCVLLSFYAFLHG
jgi:hypothetical protein